MWNGLDNLPAQKCHAKRRNQRPTKPLKAGKTGVALLFPLKFVMQKNRKITKKIKYCKMSHPLEA